MKLSTEQQSILEYSLTNEWDIMIINGPAGSGKTTLLELLSGSQKPSSGSLYFENDSYKTNWLGKIIKHEEIFYNYGYEEFGSNLTVGKIIFSLDKSLIYF